MFDLREALALVVRNEGSDLHLKVGSRPLVRVHGKLGPVEEFDRLKSEDTERLLREMLGAQPRKIEEFEADNEVDFSYAIEGLARFRVNAFRQRGTVSIAARVIPFAVRTVADLGLPPVINELGDEERGLILLTGTTGSGKSTTLAAIIDHINETKARHIVTIEDPIEYLHSDRNSIINQREVGMDTASFARAMRRVLRQDPDVILIGEMRDEETVRTALSAAETGHLVLSTVHTLDAAESINRIIDFFPLHEQSQARAMLGGTLKGVVSQRLVPTPDGNGRVVRLRDPADDRARAGHDHGPRGNRAAARGDQGGRVLRDADLRPGAATPLPGRPSLDGRRDQGRLEPTRFQAAGRRRGPDLDLDGRPRRSRARVGGARASRARARHPRANRRRSEHPEPRSYERPPVGPRSGNGSSAPPPGVAA